MGRGVGDIPLNNAPHRRTPPKGTAIPHIQGLKEGVTLGVVIAAIAALTDQSGPPPQPTVTPITPAACLQALRSGTYPPGADECASNRTRHCYTETLTTTTVRRITCSPVERITTR